VKYLMLIYGNQEKWASIPAEEWPEAIAKQDAFNRKYQATGELLGAYGLADAAAAKIENATAAPGAMSPTSPEKPPLCAQRTPARRCQTD